MKCISRRMRAIDPDEKAIRRQSILTAADALFSQSPHQLPSVSTIAREAGLAKGTVYLYFKTKEEIFLEILSQHYCQLLDRIYTFIVNEKRATTIAHSVVDVFESFITEHPGFLPLSSMANSVLEQNADVGAIIRFKAMLVDQITRISQHLCEQNPALNTTNVTRLLTSTNAMMLGLWQMYNWPEPVRTIITQPEFHALNSSFHEEMRHAVRTLWSSVLAPGVS